MSDLFVFTNQSTAHKSQNCICCCTCIFLEVVIRQRQETNLFYQEYCEACNIYQIRPQSLWSQSDVTFTDLSGNLWTRLLCVTTQVKRKCCVCVEQSFCPLHVRQSLESCSSVICMCISESATFSSLYLPLRSIPLLLSYITALSQVTIQPRRCSGLQDNCTSSLTLFWLRAPLKLVVDFSTCSVESTFFFFSSGNKVELLLTWVQPLELIYGNEVMYTTDSGFRSDVALKLLSVPFFYASGLFCWDHQWVEM